MLWHFLQFRLQVVTNRLEHELESLKKRIHILEGFEKVFDALDEIIRIIRKSDGKADSAEKIMKRFELDAEQTDAILELKLYRLARLEILVIQNELADKRKRARQIAGLLKDEEGRWKVVRDEIEEIQKKYGGKDDKRRTLIETDEEVSFTADDFIVEEDNVVIVSRDGWVKRQKEVRDLSTTRLREGDSVLAVLPGSTRATRGVLHATSAPPIRRASSTCPHRPATASRCRSCSSCATARRSIAAFSLDPRVAGDIATRKEGEPPPVHAIAVTSDGYSLRFSFEPFVEPSTRAGRRYARPSRGRRGGRRRAHHRRGNRHRGDAGCARAPLPRRRGQLPVRAGQGRHPDQADGDEDRVLGFIASTRRSRPAARRNEPRQRADHQHGQIRGHRAAAARAANCSSAASSRASFPTEVENPQPLDGSS